MSGKRGCQKLDIRCIPLIMHRISGRARIVVYNVYQSKADVGLGKCRRPQNFGDFPQNSI